MHPLYSIFAMSPTEMIISILIVLIAIYLFYVIMKKLIYNTIIGLALLFIVNYTLFASDPLPIKLWTIAITAIFGILGVLGLVVGHYLGVI